MAIQENALTTMKINDTTKTKRSLSSSQSSMQNIKGQYKEGTEMPSVFMPSVEYEIVASEDISAMQIDLVKDVPQFVSGATAQKLIERGRGKIKLYNPVAEAKKKEEADMKAELAELKEAVKEMKKSKPTKEVETKKEAKE